LSSALFISQCSLVIYIVQNVLIDNIPFNYSKKYSITSIMDDYQGLIEKTSADHRWSPWQSTC